MPISTSFQYLLPTRLVFGSGAVRQLGELISGLGGHAPLIVTDRGLQASGTLDKALASLRSANRASLQIFEEVEANPTVETVSKGLQLYTSKKCDSLIAVGGGSVMDAAKGIGILATNGGSIGDYEGLDKFDEPLPPFIAVPTTCGTGSEVTRYAIISDPEVKRKRNLANRLMFPRVAVLDPDLLSTLPQSQIAATGMDALSHALESYTSRNPNPFADALCEAAFTRISDRLLEGYANRSPRAMYELLLASTLAGMAIGNTRGGIIHAMSHPITAFAGTPHGIANAVLMPPVMRFNAVASVERFSRIAQIFEPTRWGGETSLDAALSAADIVDDIRQRLAIPAKLSEVGVTEAMLAPIIDETMKGPQLENNARIVTRQAAEEIARSVM